MRQDECEDRSGWSCERLPVQVVDWILAFYEHEAESNTGSGSHV